MNLFLLSLDPKKCAQYYCDKHVVKVIVGMTRMLYTAWWMCSPSEKWRKLAPRGYCKPIHANTRLYKWIVSSRGNYIFACQFAFYLSEEYTRRSGRIHNLKAHIIWLSSFMPISIPDGERTQQPQIMPREYRYKNDSGNLYDSVIAYRRYYKKNNGGDDDCGVAKYTNRKSPPWMKPEKNDTNPPKSRITIVLKIPRQLMRKLV